MPFGKKYAAVLEAAVLEALCCAPSLRPRAARLPAQNCAAVPYVNTMKKGEDAAESVREAVAGLWRKGAALTWDVPAGPIAGAPVYTKRNPEGTIQR